MQISRRPDRLLWRRLWHRISVNGGEPDGRSPMRSWRMVSVWSVFKLAARAAVWRMTPDSPLVGLSSLIGWAVTLAVMRVALQFAATASGPSHFNPYGLNAVVAWLAFQLAIAAFFVRPAARPAALAAMFILSIIADIVAALVQFGGPLLPTNAVLDAWFSLAPVAAAV